ncbi:LON peptidase substrate-binding domain-containing protein, partial [Klebsiella pneumoniae]|nr:LON peptidase substrate-binding domain-containing protein [Klebsiella pneumoniae]
MIFLAAQRNAKTEDPRQEDIYTTGTISQIIQLLKLPDGTVKVLVEGKQRGSLVSFLPNPDYFMAEIQPYLESLEANPELEALIRSTKSVFEGYVKLTKGIPQEVV